MTKMSVDCSTFLTVLKCQASLIVRGMNCFAYRATALCLPTHDTFLFADLVKVSSHYSCKHMFLKNNFLEVASPGQLNLIQCILHGFLFEEISIHVSTGIMYNFSVLIFKIICVILKLLKWF